jgi:predicted molibdopterin-dependent oxidoreductase YjgC
LLGRLSDVTGRPRRRADAHRGARIATSTGLNGEFLCIKGRFGHPFVNHEERIRTPLIRYKKGGKLIPATWDEAIRHVAQKLDAIVDEHGQNALGIVGSPRITNEANYLLFKFATELVGTENYTTTETFNLKPFFDALGASLATHRDIRYAKTILLIGGEPEELQPLTGKQIRQAVRNGGAKLIVANSTPIRLVEQSAQFIHIAPDQKTPLCLRWPTPDLAPAQRPNSASTLRNSIPSDRQLRTRKAIWSSCSVMNLAPRQLRQSPNCPTH